MGHGILQVRQAGGVGDQVWGAEAQRKQCRLVRRRRGGRDGRHRWHRRRAAEHGRLRQLALSEKFRRAHLAGQQRLDAFGIGRFVQIGRLAVDVSVGLLVAGGQKRREQRGTQVDIAVVHRVSKGCQRVGARHGGRGRHGLPGSLQRAVRGHGHMPALRITGDEQTARISRTQILHGLARRRERIHHFGRLLLCIQVGVVGKR